LSRVGINAEGRAHVHDEPDGLSRPLSQSSAITRSSMGTRRRNLYKKDSVARIAIDSLSLALVCLFNYILVHLT